MGLSRILHFDFKNGKTIYPFPLECVQQITRTVQTQVVLVRNGSSRGPGHQSDPADLLELAG